jgi:hypothetical protein
MLASQEGLCCMEVGFVFSDVTVWVSEIIAVNVRCKIMFEARELPVF